MLLARDLAGQRIEPSRGARARCPQCDAEVVAKCGELVTWHWAHRAYECDAWSEGESEWHLGWKRRVQPDACEVVRGDHRADITTRSGRVIELQHSALDAASIAEREAFYGDMFWLFDAREFELALYPRAARIDFEWSRPRKTLAVVKKPMYWDLGAGFVLFVEALEPGSPLGGYRGRGILLDDSCFASSVFGASARDREHELARQRARRVAECGEKARTLLRSSPELGADEALRAAMREMAGGDRHT